MALSTPLVFVLAVVVSSAGMAMATPAAQQVAPQTTESDNETFFEDEDQHGWHFYETPPVIKPEPEPPPIKPPGGVGQGTGVAPLSAQWLRENMDHYRDLAIDAPTRQNVALYAYLQRLSMDKAQRFANMMTVVSTTNPALDENSRSPISAYQRAAAERVMNVERDQLLAKLSETIGVWYFFRSDCPYCAKQDPVLHRLAGDTGLTILPISIDGRPLMSGAFPEFVMNAGQAEAMQVRVTPTLVLANPTTGETVKIAEGLKTRSEIEDRLLSTAKDRGWITDSQYDKAMHGMPRRFITDGIDPSRLASVEQSPEALLQLLREASMQGGGTPVDDFLGVSQ